MEREKDKGTKRIDYIFDIRRTFVTLSIDYFTDQEFISNHDLFVAGDA